MFVDGKLVRLGKKPPIVDPRTLKLSKYLKVAPPAVLPPAPEEASWITKLVAAEALPMYLNDQLGDCVEAAAGHMEQQWNYYAGHPYQPTDNDILAAYEAVGGYVLGDPNTDNGTDMLSFLKWWQATGLAGHRILAYVSVDWTNLDEVQIAVELFGSVYLGVQLPISAQGANDWTVPDGGIYSTNGQPGGWGGHCIPVVAGSPITKTCVTWGTTLKMSNNFFRDYADECYGVLSPDWLEANQMSPSQLDVSQLEADLNELGVLWKHIPIKH